MEIETENRGCNTEFFFFFFFKNEETVRLLGIHIDDNLNFTTLSTSFVKKKAKVHPLVRIWLTLMKEFIASQSSYCSLLWKFHSRNMEHRLSKIRKRDLR